MEKNGKRYSMQTLIKEKVLTIIWEELHFKVKNITIIIWGLNIPLSIFNRTVNRTVASIKKDFPGGSVSKESACNAGDMGSILGLSRSQKRRLQPTLVLLPGEFLGQRRLAGYRPWGHKESDMTEWLTLSLFKH